MEELFDGGTIDIEVALRQNLNWRDQLRRDPDPAKILVITQDGFIAMAFGEITFAEGEERDFFLLVGVNSEGKIDWYRTMFAPTNLGESRQWPAS